MLKDHRDLFGKKLTTDFNDAIKTGVFPENQKNADITPIFKTNGRLVKCNYRPVSILPAISKVTERLMYTQINSFMDNKLSSYQCGFRKGMSAQNCLLYLIEKWKKSLDKKGKAGVLLTDL